MLRLNTNPDVRHLRQFGLMCVLALALLPWFAGGRTSLVLMAAVVAALIGFASVLRPRFLKPLFVGLTVLTFPLGVLIGELILLGIFFGFFVPMALLFKIIGRDTLQRRPVDDAETFWSPRRAPEHMRRYFDQY